MWDFGLSRIARYVKIVLTNQNFYGIIDMALKNMPYQFIIREELFLNVVLYSTGCPQCQVLETLLHQAKIQFTVCNDEAKMNEIGLKSVPSLDVDGNKMNMLQAFNWIKEVSK